MKINIATFLVGIVLAISLQCCNSKSIGEKCADLDFTINGYNVLSADCDFTGKPSVSDTQQYLNIVENRDVIINLIHDEYNLGDFEIKVDDIDQTKHIFQNLERGWHKLSVCKEKECLHKYIRITKRIVSYEDIEKIVNARVQMKPELDESEDLNSEKQRNSIEKSPISSENKERDSKKEATPSTKLTTDNERSKDEMDKKIPPSEEDSDGDGILDSDDNCVLMSNRDQLDTDGDGEGDVCDPDDDNDGVEDKVDICPKKGEKRMIDKEGCPYLTEDKTIIGADPTCFKEEIKARSITLKFQVKERLELSSVEIHTLEKWSSALITLRTDDGDSVGKSINNERIVQTSDINLEGINKKLVPGTYTLKIEGTGEAFDISDCITGILSNDHISIKTNTHFFNLQYRHSL